MSAGPAHVAATTSVRRSWAAKRLPPLIAFILARAFLAAVGAHDHVDTFNSANWAWGDANQYLTIAKDGINLYASKGMRGYPSGTWMGNAGWMPLYPYLIRLVALTGLEVATAAAILSGLFHILSLMWIWNRFLPGKAGLREWLCLFFAAFFPNQVIQHAAYPVSMMVFLLLIAIDALLVGRWWLAGILAGLATDTYSMGFLFAAAAALWIVLPPLRIPWPRLMKPIVIVGGFTAAAIGGLFLLDYHVTGHWNAFLLIQAKYNHHATSPATTLFEQLAWIFYPELEEKVVTAQVAFIAILAISAVASVGIKWKQRTPIERLLAVYAGVFWIYPLCMGTSVYPYRPEACLLPMVPLFRRWHWAILIPMIAISILISTIIAQQFFIGRIW